MGAHSCVPPCSFGLSPIFGKEHFKAPFAVVTRLLPPTLPQETDDLRGGETTAVLGVRPIPVLVQHRLIPFIVFDLENLPFSAEIRRCRLSRAADERLRRHWGG